MKEERLIGNSGIQEVRQQCLELLEEIRQSAGVLNDFFGVEEDQEYFYVFLDEERKVIMGLRRDGVVYIPNLYSPYVEENFRLLKEKLSFVLGYIQEEENPEWIRICLDSAGNVIEGIKRYGSKVVNVDTIIKGILSCNSFKIDEFSFAPMNDPEGRSEILLDREKHILSYRKPDGTKVENVGIETPKVHTGNLELTEDGMSDFQQALKDAGFQPGGSGDYTDKDSMYIPEPRLAHLNIITDFNLTTLTKTSDVKCAVEFFDGAGNYFKKWIILNGQGRSSLNYLKKGLGADFFNEDPNGDYFDEDNVFSMKFGDWVPQDSFHIKSFYTDFTRCTTPVCYRLTHEVLATRGLLKDRPYKKYYVDKYSDTAPVGTTPDKLDYNLETGAKCVPEGFPVIVYQNGEFWGVNSWQLKKHRDNYQMSKKSDKNIHLDGYFGFLGSTKTPSSCFYLADGDIDWGQFCDSYLGMEVRNPKNLYCIDGKKYDADTHSVELVDTATAEAWIAAGVIQPTGKVIDSTLAGYLRTTGKVRARMEEVTTYIPQINRLAVISTSNGDIAITTFEGSWVADRNFSKGVYVKDGDSYYMSIHTTNTGNPVSDTDNWHDITSDIATIRAFISEVFNVESFIDYMLISNVIGDIDAFENNTQLTTWGAMGSSSHFYWAANKYDCDLTFGTTMEGNVANAAYTDKIGSGNDTPLFKVFWQFHYEDLETRYKELRDLKLFDADHIIQLFRDWMDRVGHHNYEREFEKWPETPSFRDGSKTYPNRPTSGGFYGSIYRIYNWVKKRIDYMDAQGFFNYTQN